MKRKLKHLWIKFKNYRNENYGKPLKEMPAWYLLAESCGMGSIAFLLWTTLLKDAWVEFFKIWEHHPLDKQGTLLGGLLLLMTAGFVACKYGAFVHWKALVEKGGGLS